MSVRSGSTNSNSGGTLHSATRVIVHESYNSSIRDYDVALIQVCVLFIVSIYNEMCITYCCDNQLHLMPLTPILVDLFTILQE